MTKLTNPQRARLDKLATYLEGLPKRYRHFDMGVFLNDNGDEAAVEAYVLNNGGVNVCGTVACAVGHGPAAGVFFPRAMAGRLGKAGHRFLAAADIWFEYASLFVGTGQGDGSLFEWAFGGSWVTQDNGHRGAAARIRYLLDKGRPPKGFVDAEYRYRKLYAPYRIDAAERLAAK